MDKEILNKEKLEAGRLLNKHVAFSFSIQLPTEVNVRKGLLGALGVKRKAIENVKQEFVIAEPTLGTLDRMSREWIEIAKDCEGDKMAEHDMVSKHARRCARVVALAVMGKEYNKAVVNHGIVQYVPNGEKLEELTDIFYNNVKPSDLMELMSRISLICNLGDFSIATRLMIGERTSAGLVAPKED